MEDRIPLAREWGLKHMRYLENSGVLHNPGISLRQQGLDPLLAVGGLS